MKWKLVKRLLLLAACLSWFTPAAQAFYNPSTGRWLSRDTIGEAGGINLQAFVNDDPVNFWDYLGLAEDFPFTVKDLGRQAPHDGKGGETPLEAWVVAAPVEDCTCRDRAHINAGGHAEVHHWWSTPDTKVHEEHHVELFRQEWDAMKQEIEPYIGSCKRRKVAECHRDLIVSISHFHKLKAFYLNADFDCKEYGNVPPFKRCDAAKDYEKEMNKQKQRVDNLSAKCSGL